MACGDHATSYEQEGANEAPLSLSGPLLSSFSLEGTAPSTLLVRAIHPHCSLVVAESIVRGGGVGSGRFNGSQSEVVVAVQGAAEVVVEVAIENLNELVEFWMIT